MWEINYLGFFFLIFVILNMCFELVQALPNPNQFGYILGNVFTFYFSSFSFFFFFFLFFLFFVCQYGLADSTL